MPTDDLIPIEHYKLIFKCLPSLYLILTPDFRMVAANDARYSSTLSKPEDVIGKDIFEVFTDNPQDLLATGIENLRASLEKVVRTRLSDIMPVQKYSIAPTGRKDGEFEVRYWLPSNSPILNDKGDLLYIVHKVEDITKFVENSETLNEGGPEVQTKLMAQVFEHTEEIKRINKELGEEREFRDQFIASITHDLRTPLTAAKISAQLISRAPDKIANIQKQSFRITHNLERADQMIQNVLDISQIQAGKTPRVDLTPCNVHSLLESVLEELSTIFGDRFVLTAPSEPINGVLDCNGLQRIIENLCSNAIKYGSTDQKITIQLERIKDQVKISVHNWGAPISKEDQAVLFQPYHRSQSAQTDKIRGWGIGLTVVQGIVQAHHGTVHVKSSIEEGTTFTITLPDNLSELENKGPSRLTGT